MNNADLTEALKLLPYNREVRILSEEGDLFEIDSVILSEGIIYLKAELAE